MVGIKATENVLTIPLKDLTKDQRLMVEELKRRQISLETSPPIRLPVKLESKTKPLTPGR